MVQVERECHRCGDTWTKPLGNVTHGVEEYTLENGRRVDVALFLESNFRAAVEIRATHAVDAAKAASLKHIRWVELDAEQVVEDPLRWRPTRRRRKELCPGCEQTRRGVLDACREVGAPLWVALRIERLDRERKLYGEAAAIIARSGRDLCLGDAPVARTTQRVSFADWREAASVRATVVKRAQQGNTNYAELLTPLWTIAAALKVHGGEFLPPRARGGELTRAKRWSELRRISALTGQPVPSRGSPYWAEPYVCWNRECGAEMLVYAWPGHSWRLNEDPPPPVPRTLEFRGFNGASYWMNTCPECGSGQGDSFIYEPNGPLPKRFANRRWEYY